MADWVLQLIGLLGVSCGVYAGVKSDITRAVLKAEIAHESANSAHARIDSILK